MRHTTSTLWLLALALAPCVDAVAQWSDAQLRVLRSLSLAALPPVPADPSNRVADDPAAARLGAQLFFDTRLSANGRVACASCHQPGLHFSDGLPQGVGVGRVQRHTPTLESVAWQSWFYWDGRRDSLWSQALVPVEAPLEMGGSRLAAVRLVGEDDDYRRQYEALFGPFPARLRDPALPAQAGPFGSDAMRDAWARLPAALRPQVNRVYANLGKAMAAYERTLRPGESAFDRYVEVLLRDGEAAAAPLLPEAAIRGAALFIDPARTQCLQCHNGPLLSNGGFHNIGTGTFSGEHLDYGRALGVQAVVVDEFNCLGEYSDAEPDDCAALRFMPRDQHSTLAGAFKTPTLRNVALTGPYMHDGRFHTLGRVLRHYVAPPPQGESGHHELRSLALSDAEIGDLIAFLEALSAPPPAARPPGRAAVETETAAPAARMPPAGLAALSSFSASERGLLATLALSSLPPAPPDRGNAVSGSAAAARLGRLLFDDPGLSGNGRIACATCHQAERDFTDGRPVAQGVAALERNTPGLLGVAHRRWLYRDGRKDSLWSQALAPLEAPREMGGSRLAALRHVSATPALRDAYEQAFGALPAFDWPALPASAGPLGSAPQQRAWAALAPALRQRITQGFVHLGKALAAYERTLTLAPSRFDAWLADPAGAPLSADELAGLKLFLSGRTMCVSCHNGPLLSDGAFHNIGTGTAPDGTLDRGREGGIALLAADEFNCRSAYSDDATPDCGHLDRLGSAEVPGLLRGAFRTPGLRGLAATAPYMHDGRFRTLDEVVAFYANPPDPGAGRHELSPLPTLNRREQKQLVRFLLTL